MPFNKKIPFIDLGLPSGTLWASSNVPGRMSWEKAVSEYGEFLPTLEQFEELRKHCTVRIFRGLFRKNGCACFTGPNGKNVRFPNLGRVTGGIGDDHYCLKDMDGSARYKLSLARVIYRVFPGEDYSSYPKEVPMFVDKSDSDLLVHLVSNK